jgi:hypothetical protein
MAERWINKLSVFGTQKELTKFQKSNWKRDLRGRYWELQETMRLGRLRIPACLDFWLRPQPKA